MKWLLLQVLFVTLTLELSSGCQVKSSPVNLYSYLDLSSTRLKFN